MYRLECANWGESCNTKNCPEGCPDNCPTYGVEDPFWAEQREVDNESERFDSETD